MEIKHRIIMKRIDGVPVNNRYEPVESISRAARFPTIEDYERFVTGYYKPVDPSQYAPKEIRITYEEVSDNEPLPEDSRGQKGSGGI